MKNNNIKAYIAYLLICLIWGSTPLAIKIGVEDVPPMLFAGLRWFFSGVLFTFLLWIKGYKLPSLKDLKHIAIIGLSLIGIGNGLVTVAELWLPSGLTALLITSVPFFVAIISNFFPQGERLNYKTVSGLFLGFTGVALLMYNEVVELQNSSYLIGAAIMMFALAVWGFGTNYSKHAKIDVHPFMSATFQMIIAGGAQSLIGFAIGEWQHFSLEGGSLYAFLYLALIASSLGYGSYMYAIKHLPVSFVSTYAYVNPLLALFLGWIILNENLSPMLGVSAIIIFTGVWLVQKAGKANNPPAKEDLSPSVD